jgi:hypothetical protein
MQRMCHETGTKIRKKWPSVTQSQRWWTKRILRNGQPVQLVQEAVRKGPIKPISHLSKQHGISNRYRIKKNVAYKIMIFQHWVIMTMIIFVGLNTDHVHINRNRSIVYRKMKYRESQKIPTDQSTCRGGQRKISLCINVLLLMSMVNILARFDIKYRWQAGILNTHTTNPSLLVTEILLLWHACHSKSYVKYKTILWWIPCICSVLS